MRDLDSNRWSNTVIANHDTNDVSISFTYVNRNFKLIVKYLTGNNCAVSAVTDFDNDTTLNIIVVNVDNISILVYEINGT